MSAGSWNEWTDTVKHATGVARLIARVSREAGLLSTTTPRGVLELAKALATRRTSPSTLYRYHAATQPNKVALIGKGQELTYAQLDGMMDRIASKLRADGIQGGQRVVLMLRNRPEFVALHPAVGRAGASVVSVSWHATPQELAFVLEHSDARAIFFERDMTEVVSEALKLGGSIPAERAIAVGNENDDMDTARSFVRWLAEARPGRPPNSTDEGSVIAYTSGTTGKPKGASRNFSLGALEAAFSWISQPPFYTSEVHLAVLPLYHSTAYAFMNLTHMVGGTVVLLDRFTPETFLQAVQDYQVTQTALVPTLLHRLVELEPRKRQRWNISSLRSVFSAGAPLSAELARRFMNIFGDILWNYYGSTETGLNTVASPEDLHLSPNTVGRPLESNQLRILDEQGRDVPPGQVGELFVKGSLMISGYHGNEQASQQLQRDGFFTVGDLARVDDRGCYHIVGRKRDMIISGGVNVYPAEVEADLESHPDIEQVAVIGTPDDEWGERVVAFIVPSGGMSEDTEQLEERLRNFAKDHMSGPKRPREYHFIENLPRNPTGKVLKRQLRQMLTSNP